MTKPFVTLVKERRSVRKYKANHIIPAQDLNNILEMAHTATFCLEFTTLAHHCRPRTVTKRQACAYC